MRRRAFLAACVAAGAAGCGSGRPTTDGDADPAAATTDAPASADAPATERTKASPTAPPTPSADRTETAPASRTATVTDAATPTEPPVFPGYETTEVRVTTPDGDSLGSVTAAVADTGQLRYTGLSDTDSLPADMGMLFVYERVGEHTYVMRDMDFGLDIVYADDDGAITRIHHAPAPGPNEDGEDQTYPGRGQYVLEVNRGWTTERGVEVGDLLRFGL